MKKTIVTISGIRPDFIRMSEIFKKLDENFNHILIHSGQHYDNLLSGVFFNELKIRTPDYNLEIGALGKEHFEQTGELSSKIIHTLRNNKINPDLILFLGDSNSVLCAPILKKEGYKIGHIEAGMRSGDKRMFEEINRVVCDHCSDIHFVYHENYKNKLINEGINHENIHVVGNTIVEVLRTNLENNIVKSEDYILVDIHRPENFKSKSRLENIILYLEFLSTWFDNIEIRLLGFKRTLDYIWEYKIDLGRIKVIDLVSYKEYIKLQSNALVICSDSGTAQEEPALLNKYVIVPRDFTERPESIENNCSFMLDVNTKQNHTWKQSIFNIDLNLNKFLEINNNWLGDGNTSNEIVRHIKNFLK